MFRCPLDDDRPCAPVRVFARGAAICGRHLLSSPPHPGTPTTTRCDTTRRRDGKAASWASSGGSTAGGWHGQLHTRGWCTPLGFIAWRECRFLLTPSARNNPRLHFLCHRNYSSFAALKRKKMLFKVFRRSTGLVFAALFCSSRQAKNASKVVVLFDFFALLPV